MGEAVSGAVKSLLKVLVERDAFSAGELIEGTVVLRLTEPIQCQGQSVSWSIALFIKGIHQKRPAWRWLGSEWHLVVELSLSIEGTERISWTESDYETSYSVRCSNNFLLDKVMRDPEQMGFTQRLTCSMFDQIAFVTQDAYGPGKYRFRFSYRFDEAAPVSFELSNTFAGRMGDLKASITYSLKAELVTKHREEASTTVALIAQRFAHPVYSLSDHASKAVRTLGVVSKGDCEILARMDRDAWVSGGNLLVQTSIRNRSTMNMSSISLKLYELINVSMLGYKDAQDSKCVCQTKTPGERAGDQQDQELSLPLLTKRESRSINPTISEAANLQLSYKLVIKCKFPMATGVKVELPVVVLPHEISGVGDAAATIVDPARKLDSAAFSRVKPMPRCCESRVSCW